MKNFKRALVCVLLSSAVLSVSSCSKEEINQNDISESVEAVNDAKGYYSNGLYVKQFEVSTSWMGDFHAKINVKISNPNLQGIKKFTFWIDGKQARSFNGGGVQDFDTSFSIGSSRKPVTARVFFKGGGFTDIRAVQK